VHLTRSTDFGLRVLILLAGDARAELVSTRELSRVLGVSDNHLRKITTEMVAQGWLEARRGHGGGVRLAVTPTELRLGQVVRALEGLALLECFDPQRDSCALSSACRLKGLLAKALESFLAVLDEHTLADVAADKRLRRVLDLAEE
jgi:Rrf2 family nitric oxide-sensitive transcriptional repressor